jgi:uncharacterized membrane protein YkvA (DUF1232 family)
MSHSDTDKPRSTFERFWPKVKATLGKVPFLDDALAAYYCATDPATPSRIRIMLIAALAYFITPADAIPDFIVGLGFTDAATVLLATLAMVRGAITQVHRDHARERLAQLTRERRN